MFLCYLNTLPGASLKQHVTTAYSNLVLYVSLEVLFIAVMLIKTQYSWFDNTLLVSICHYGLSNP